MRDENDRSLIVIKTKGDESNPKIFQFKRKILVYGFCNHVSNGELSSACCIDCWGGLHGDNAVKTMKLESGDYVIASQELNFISIISNGSVFKVKEFVFHERKQENENEEWCVMCLNNNGASWYVKEENDDSNNWTLDIEKANVFTCKEAEELATNLMSSLGRGSYYAKRKN